MGDAIMYRCDDCQGEFVAASKDIDDIFSSDINKPGVKFCPWCGGQNILKIRRA